MENHLLNLISDQPYLACNILYLLWLIIGLFMFAPANQRMIIIISGLISVPCFPFLILFENSYWIQNRIGGWVLGIEDAICSFAVAAMAWLVISMMFRNKISSKISTHGAFHRYISFAGISVGLFLIFFSIKLSPMTALVLSNLIVWILLAFLRRELLMFSLAGMIGFGLVHFLLMKTCFLIFPHSILSWNLGNSWGTLIFGVPLGEIAWAMVYGAFWSLFTAHSLGIRLHDRLSPSAQGI